MRAVRKLAEAPRRAHPRRAYPRGAFTLLEMLLTTLLSAVLMVGIWSLSTLYIAFFESGRERTQEAQLVRSLMQQFSDDLLAAIQILSNDASPPAASTLTGPVRRGGPVLFVEFTTRPHFGLVGAQRSLQLTILRAAPPLDQENLDGRLESLPHATSRPIVRAPDLRRIVYSFEEPYESQANDRRPPAGLLRRELAWETARSLADDEDAPLFGDSFHPTAVSSPLPADEPGLAAVGEERLENDAQPAEQSADESILLVPEVVAIEFRYFDGQAWSSQWDSRTRKTLPVAVEIAMEVMSTKELQEQQHDLVADDQRPHETDHQTEAMSAVEEPRGRVYRKLIFLPAAARPGHSFDASEGEVRFSLEQAVRTGP